MDENNKTGSGIFNFIFLNNLAKFENKNDFYTVFSSGASNLPFKIESIDYYPSSNNPAIIRNGKHIMFELALISEAFKKQEEFDLFHVNIGDGDLVLPFSEFVKRPILITLHNIINEDFTRKYFSLFENKNLFFVSVSNFQRKMLPLLNYIDNIYHGINLEQYNFDAKGGENIMWAGRYIPEKGPQLVIELAKKTGYKTKLFGVMKNGYENWYENNIKNIAESENCNLLVSLHANYSREQLINFYQTSKVFILPTFFEEAFGLVYVESMACGTPVITFARGAAPEIIKDGITGFLVNPSDDDIRGEWIIKKTGVDGLQEAIEKIYKMNKNVYEQMRQKCREHAEENFSAKKMTERYVQAYRKVLEIYANKK